MKKIQKKIILILLTLTLVPLFTFAQNTEFPTEIRSNSFNGSAIQNPEIKNTEAFPTGSVYSQHNGSALQSASTGGLKQKTLQQLVADFILLASGYILRIILGLIVLTFMYGLMKYMFKGQGSDTARTEGRKLMLWGIIGIFVVTSVWGLVSIFTSFVGHDSIVIPQFK